MEDTDIQASTSGVDSILASPYPLHDVLCPLEAIQEEERRYCCRMLLQCLTLQREFIDYLEKRREVLDVEEVSEQNKVLMKYLKAYQCGLTGFPHLYHFDMLEAEAVHSAMGLPFVYPAPGGSACFGVPTNDATSVLCDNISELSRAALAAAISFYVYLNFSQTPDDLSPDETTLRFTTLVVNSCTGTDRADRLNAEIQELGVDVSVSEVKWLMHFIRAVVIEHMGHVSHLLGNKDKHIECLVAQQQDFLQMIKCMPANPLSYVLHAKSCLQFQQMKLACAFLKKGMAVAESLGDDYHLSHMCYQLALAKLHGGEGSMVVMDDILELQQRGEACRQQACAWMPDSWDKAMEATLEKTAVETALQKIAERDVREPGPGTEVEALTALYVTRPPEALPPGALINQERPSWGKAKVAAKQG